MSGTRQKKLTSLVILAVFFEESVLVWKFMLSVRLVKKMKLFQMRKKKQDGGSTLRFI